MQTPEAYEHRQSLQTRLVVLRVAAIAGMCALVVSFWLLQVVQNSKFETMAQSNHLRSVPLRAPRGVLFDRNGRELVQNRRSFTITIVREPGTDVASALDRLAQVLSLEPAVVAEILAKHRRRPLFRIPVVEHASLEQVARVTAHQLELPEVQVEEVPARTYPAGGLAAHVFGYVGEIRQEQVGSEAFGGLGPGAVVGQSGIERVYNAQLQGVDGSRSVVVNSVGREIEVLREDEPTPGHRLQLTIDYDLQRALEDGFLSLGFTGAAAVLDPKTGEILAMTSLPAYNPNDFVAGIDPETLNALNTDVQKPFLNKLIRGRYPPGSTFKIVMALAALGEGLITPQHTEFCNGSATIYGHTRQCLGRHGFVDLTTAIEKSCNVYFYHLGTKVPIDTIHEYAKKLGLVGLSGIDLPGEQESEVGSTEWKKRRFGEPWYPGDTVSVAIGQGYVDVTPIAMATMMATVANGGTLVTPHLVRAVDDGSGWRTLPTAQPRGSLFIKPGHLDTIREAMRRVIDSGTGVRSRIAGVEYGAKTGTAQANISLARRRAAGNVREFRDHGWFVFFAPLENPQLAGVIFGEHAEHGSSTGPIAKHVIETFLAKQAGRPLPPPPPMTAAAQATRPAAPAAGAPGTGAPGTAGARPAAQSPGGAGGR
jgi:penicillin-binding protein 2